MLPGRHFLRLVGEDKLGKLFSLPVDKVWTTRSAEHAALSLSLANKPLSVDPSTEATFRLVRCSFDHFFWRLNGGYCDFILFLLLLLLNMLCAVFRRWHVASVAAPLVIKSNMLIMEKLNSWEATAIRSSTAAATTVYQWIPGAKEGSSSEVTLTGLADGHHSLLMKARDRAGNVSPQVAQVNWTVDTTAPSNCSVLSVNGRSLGTWRRDVVLPIPVNSSTVFLVLSASSSDTGGPFSAVVSRWWSASQNSGSATGGSGTARHELNGSSLEARVELRNLSDGKYTLHAFGEDVAGNMLSTSCANLTWAVDLFPPVG